MAESIGRTYRPNGALTKSATWNEGAEIVGSRSPSPRQPSPVRPGDIGRDGAYGMGDNMVPNGWAIDCKVLCSRPAGPLPTSDVLVLTGETVDQQHDQDDRAEDDLARGSGHLHHRKDR